MRIRYHVCAMYVRVCVACVLTTSMIETHIAAVCANARVFR